MTPKQRITSPKDALFHYMLCIITLGLFSVAKGQISTAEMEICTDICNREDFLYIEYNDCLYACNDVINQLASSQTAQLSDSDPLQGVNYLDNNIADTENDQDVEKRKSSFVRIGRQKSSFVRIGRSADDIPQKRPSSFVRIGKSDPEFVGDALSGISKRASSFVRIGKSSPPQDARYLFKRPSSFVRIGKKSDPLQDELEAEKRKSSFVRIGKSMPEFNEDKRASSFVRIGRPSSFVRIGKKANEDLKRVSSFVRIGKKDEYDSQADALNSNQPFANSGLFDRDEDQKRASNFVRIGKSYDEGLMPEIGDADKRASSFVRIGKSSPFGSKRMSNFVRIGKRVVRSAESNKAEDMVDDSDIN